MGSNSDTRGYEVEEVVVTAPSEQGYAADSTTYHYYDADPDGGMTQQEFQQWVWNEADTFVAGHVTGGGNDSASILIRESMWRLFVNAFQAYGVTPTTLTVSGPLGNTIDMNELWNSIHNVYVHIGPHGLNDPAQSVWRADGSRVDIYIDTNRLGSYVTAFGDVKAYNWVAYHELGHSMADSFAYMQSGASLADQQKFANELGQALSEMTGASYPNDTQLGYVGGTVTR